MSYNNLNLQLFGKDAAEQVGEPLLETEIWLQVVGTSSCCGCWQGAHSLYYMVAESILQLFKLRAVWEESSGVEHIVCTGGMGSVPLRGLSSLGLPTSCQTHPSSPELQDWDQCSEQHDHKNNSFKLRTLAFGKWGSRNPTKNAFPKNKDMPRKCSSLKYQPWGALTSGWRCSCQVKWVWLDLRHLFAAGVCVSPLGVRTYPLVTAKSLGWA